jgi:hypothetical protein
MKSRFYFGLTGFLIFIACTRIEELRYGEMRGFMIHESGLTATTPGVTLLKSGELLVVFREGERGDSPDGIILMSMSKDRGKTWTYLDTIVSTPWDCRAPSIVQLSDGLIVVNFFQTRYDNQGRSLGTVGCFNIRSFDNGKTFTAPRMVPIPGYDWTATTDAIVELHDGSLLFPAYGVKEGGDSDALVVISLDGSETWGENHVIAEGSENGIQYEKPALVQFPDGRIFCLLETVGANDFLYRSVSEDGGLTWSPPEYSGIVGKAPDLHLTDENTLLCVYQDFWPRGVSLVRSYDWGRTWEKEVSLVGLESGEPSPCLVTLGDGLYASCYAIPNGGGRMAGDMMGIGGIFFMVRKPETPRGFSASSLERERVNLRWNPVEGANYYIVYRDTIQDFIPELGYPFSGNGIASPTSPRYTDVRVDSGQTYYYRISAVYGTGELIRGTGSVGEPTEVIGVDVR